MIRFFFTLSFLLTASAAQAMDLAELQKVALENRAQVQRFMINVDKGEKDIIQAKSGYYPALDLSYTITDLDEASTTEREENGVIAGRLSWNLFDGFKDKYSILSAEQLRDVEQLRLRGIQQDIQLSVSLSYLNVYDRLANLSVAEAAFTNLEKVYRDGENRYEVGLIGRNDLLKFRVDYDNADIARKEAQGDVDKSVNSLARQVGVKILLSELKFTEFADLPGELDENEYMQGMLASRSELQAIEGLIRASESQVQVAVADYYPQLDLVTSLSRYDDDFVVGNGTIDEDELRSQLVLSLNLFEGYTTEAATGKVRLEKRGLQYDLKELQDDLGTELSNLFIDYRVSLANVKVAKRSIEQAEENLRITQLKYDEGLERESDLLDAIASLSRARFNEVTAIRTVFSNYFQLRRMISGF